MTTETDDSPIPEEDVRAMVRLLSQVASTQGSHEEKKRALMEGLCKLLSADYWVWALAADFDADRPIVYTAMNTGGFDEEQFGKWLLALDHPDLIDMAKPLGEEIVRERRQVTRIQRDFDPDNVFFLSPAKELWKEADVGPPLVCYRPVSRNCLSSIGIYRKFDAPQFGRREARIAHIILTEVAWLHEEGWPWESSLQVPHLPKRCQNALNLLLEGLSRKQIADRMDISIHTANEYIKKVYELYSVHSQAELVSRFRMGDGGDRHLHSGEGLPAPGRLESPPGAGSS